MKSFLVNSFALIARTLSGNRLKLFFQISTNVHQGHIIAVIMLCVTTPREDTIVPARKVLLGMEKTVQVTFLPLPCSAKTRCVFVSRR